MTQCREDALAQLKKASKLSNRAYRKNGPKSYKNGQGALLKVLHKRRASPPRASSSRR